MPSILNIDGSSAMLTNPFSGSLYLFRGAQLLLLPNIRKFVIIPLTINIVLFALLVIFGMSQFGALVDWLTPELPEWLQWLVWIFWVVFFFATLLLVFYTFTLVANFICAPFNSLLAAAVERHLLGTSELSSTSTTPLLKEIGVSFSQALTKLSYMAVRALPLMLLFLIPLVNIAAPLLWIIFSAWVLALEYLDYPMGNHNIHFASVREQAAERRLLNLGFGGATMLATMIPVVNFIVMPAAVAGATLMWVEQYAKKRENP